jgi:hypothetical protein
MSVAATSALIGRRACAALAAGSAGLHGVMLGHAPNLGTGALIAMMIAACLYCARDLWVRGTLRGWCVVALMNLAMIAVHLPAPGHHHTAETVTVGQQSTIMALATTLAAVEVAVAAAVLVHRSRGRFPQRL